jgi:hypothetical protein
MPGEGMSGEIHYWRDLARILDDINNEIKQSFVEITVQVLSLYGHTDKHIHSSIE